jgi:hypothetical protein
VARAATLWMGQGPPACRPGPGSEHALPVLVLVEQVPERLGSSCVAGLRAEGAQGEVVALLHLHPVLVQPVDGLALQHVEAVLHDVGLGERDGSAGLEGHDVHAEVVAEIVGVQHACGAPCPLGVGHLAGLEVRLVAEGQAGRVPLQWLGTLADPVETRRLGAVVARGPRGTGGQEPEAAGTEHMRPVLGGHGQLTLHDEQETGHLRLRLWLGCLTAGRNLQDGLGERGGSPGHGTVEDPGAGLAPLGVHRGHDVLHDPTRDHGVGLGDHGTVGEQVGLRRVTTMGCVVGVIRHV